MNHRVTTAIVLACSLSAAGCRSAPDQPVDVVYRFEGVRVGPGVDEWAPIRTVLQKHGSGPVLEDKRRRATVAGVDINDYKAGLKLPNFAAADQVNADIQRLAETSIGGSRLEFGLVDAAVLYRGNTVAAGVQVYVAGFATEGFTVKLFPAPDAEPIALTAGRNGLWSTRLERAPEGGWLYGLSQDPDGKVRTRYFRVNMSTQKQEQVDAAEFLKRFPRAAAPAAPPAPSAAPAPVRSPEPKDAKRKDKS